MSMFMLMLIESSYFRALMAQRIRSNFSLNQIVQKHSDTLAAAACAILIFLGWLCLHLGWISIALLIFQMLTSLAVTKVPLKD